MTITELDHLLAIDEAGVIGYDDELAIAERVQEWCDTPVGSVWGDPRWGCSLDQYRHEPLSDDTAAMIESTIAIDLARDLPSINLAAIRVTPTQPDLFAIELGIAQLSQNLVMYHKIKS